MTEQEAQQRIARDLLSLGLRPGGVVMAHSSLSSMGRVPGGPETVVGGLLEALGANGTLLMPALTYQRVTASQPVFDVLHTPSNVGAVPEHFRKRAGTLRSVHPTHSVCGLGPEAKSILQDHYLDHTQVGEHSPFRILRRMGGQILMLGCGLRPNTSMHGVEEMIGPPYLFGPFISYRVLRADRSQVQTKVRCYKFRSEGWRQRYDRIEPLLEDDGMVTGKVLAATAQVIDSRVLWERAAAAMGGDPFFFVEKLK